MTIAVVHYTGPDRSYQGGPGDLYIKSGEDFTSQPFINGVAPQVFDVIRMVNRAEKVILNITATLHWFSVSGWKLVSVLATGNSSYQYFFQKSAPPPYSGSRLKNA